MCACTQGNITSDTANTKASSAGGHFLSFQDDNSLREQNEAAELFVFLKNQQPVGKQKNTKQCVGEPLTHQLPVVVHKIYSQLTD